MSSAVIINHAPCDEAPARQALVVLSDFLLHYSRRPAQSVVGSVPPYQLLLGEAEPLPETELAQVKDDGYLLFPTGTGMVIAARNAKGLLNAVCGYLAWHGVLWPKPGAEVLPSPGPLRFPQAPILRNPAFARRGIFHSQPPAEFPAWCQWYARLQFNEVSIHGGPEEWKVYQAEAERWGMTLQLGGHGLSQFLPRDDFSAYPDYFRALQPPDFDKTRLNDSNLCASSPAALDKVRKGARRFAQASPGARAYHLWADDLPAGGWCYCARCMGMPPQDQALLANNAVAEGVCSIDIHAKTAHLLYHDTLEPPRLVKPHPALLPLWAPRERCYAHALDDPSCARNRWHRERLEKTLDYFGRPEWETFEYYSDYILFRAMMPLIPEVVAADLKYYKSQGLDCAQHLLVATVVGILGNLHVFAAQCWDLEADPWEPLKRLAQGVPGLLKAWRLQARASYRWLDISDWPLDRYFDYRFLLERPVKESRAYRKGCARAAEQLTKAVAVLPEKLPPWADRERLALETSAGICRQMEAQMEMLEELGRCAGGEDRAAQANAAYREAVRRAGPVGKAFRKAKMHGAYFFGLERLLEEMWKEKAESARGCRSGKPCH